MAENSRNRYYIEYPRDFANEYTVYVAPADRAAEFEAKFPGAERITRAEAIERGLQRPRLAKQCSEQWYGGFAESAGSALYGSKIGSDGYALAYADEIECARIATAEIMEEDN